MASAPLCACGRAPVIVTWREVISVEEEERPDGTLRVVGEHRRLEPWQRGVCRACHAKNLLRGLDADALRRSFDP